MSARKTFALVAALILAGLNTACVSTGDRYYDPSSGVRTPVVLSGVCYPGQKEKGKNCVCEREGSNYKNCTFQIAAAVPLVSYQWLRSECTAASLTDYQFELNACLRGQYSSVNPRSVIFGAQGQYGYTQPGYYGPNYQSTFPQYNGTGQQPLAPGIYTRNGQQCQVPYRCPDTGHPLCRIQPC